jgi:hypothetical protein
MPAADKIEKMSTKTLLRYYSVLDLYLYASGGKEIKNDDARNTLRKVELELARRRV